jgi:hypothetical protein
MKWAHVRTAIGCEILTRQVTGGRFMKWTLGGTAMGLEIETRQGTGVDVMITIFCHFWQFSANKIGVFLNNQC